MRKIYIDLIITVISVYLLLKNPLPFLITLAVLLAIWFLALNDKKRKFIKDKIREFYR